MADINRGNPTSFQLILPILPEEENIGEHQELRLNIVDTLIPSVSLGEIELHWRSGQSYMEGGGIEFGEWTTNFIVDSNFNSWKTIFNWIFSINNNKDIHGRIDYSYVCDAKLEILDNFENIILKINFENIWPRHIGDIQLDYQQSEPIIKCPVIFVYDRYSYSD